jgi:succinate dehydrogenase / fumarate reductase cytochrome b subunit
MKQKKLWLSSISHKYIVALAGIFLMLFLVAHLSTNLLMLTGDREAFDKAVEFLTTNPLMKVMEYALFAGFIIHILLGVTVYIKNLKARPVNYKMAQNSETSAFSKFMIHTGVIILVFLVIHFVHFFFVKLGLAPVPEGAADKLDFYTMSQIVFSNGLYSLIYVVCMIFLGFHLKHAFQSAFQTLGLNHPRYFPIIKAVGTIYAIAIFVGFSSIPIYFYFFQ